MTPADTRKIAKGCQVAGLVEHGNAIRIALDRKLDCTEAIGDAWAAATEER